MNMKNTIKIVTEFLKVALVASVGGLVTAPSVKGWYTTINKPPFNPPSWLFSPVWTTLFMLMAISAYLVLKNSQDSKQLNKSIGIYNIQLGLNLLWSILFFGLKNPTYAFIEIIILWGAILYTIILFRKVNKTSAILLIPYLLWVSFAAFLNLTIVLIN
jgi:translocator protein